MVIIVCSILKLASFFDGREIGNSAGPYHPIIHDRSHALADDFRRPYTVQISLWQGQSICSLVIERLKY